MNLEKGCWRHTDNMWYQWSYATDWEVFILFYFLPTWSDVDIMNMLDPIYCFTLLFHCIIFSQENTASNFAPL